MGRTSQLIYIQDYGSPLTLCDTVDGTHQQAMQIAQSMLEFCDYLSELMKRHANMDFQALSLSTLLFTRPCTNLENPIL